MPGRTHGQHAVPIAFGQKAASWADELRRCVARLDRLADEVACVQLGGAAGSLAALGDDAAAVRAQFAANLGLPEPEVAWHAARDRIREIAHVLSQIAAAGERIAAEVVRLQATEVAELREPAAAGHVGSSTMPQKRNPMTSEYLIASARLVHASDERAQPVRRARRRAGHGPVGGRVDRAARGADPDRQRGLKLRWILAGWRSTPPGCEQPRRSPAARSWPRL